MGVTFWPIVKPHTIEPTEEEEQILEAETRQQRINDITERAIELQQGTYMELIELGVDKDIARSVLSPMCVNTGFLPD